MKSINIFGLNLDSKWHDKEANFQKIESELQDVEADLILLPEMFSTGFSMEPVGVADRELETLAWMKKWAKQRNVALCGSAAVYASGRYVNRMYFVQPQGDVLFYDKKHLFSFSGEDKLYTPGQERVVVSYKGVRFLLQVCYDLRFPVFSRYQGDYDAILYVANWPEKRIEHWQSLLKARAIENQAYVFGVNRTGHDGNGLDYPISSYFYFADGSSVGHARGNGLEGQLDLAALEKYRAHYRFLDDKDPFSVG